MQKSRILKYKILWIQEGRIHCADLEIKTNNHRGERDKQPTTYSCWFWLLCLLGTGSWKSITWLDTVCYINTTWFTYVSVPPERWQRKTHRSSVSTYLALGEHNCDLCLSGHNLTMQILKPTILLALTLLESQACSTRNQSRFKRHYYHT